MLKLLLTASVVCLAGLPAVAEVSVETTVTEEVLPVVTVARVEAQQVKQLVPVTGTLVAQQLIQINPQISGLEIEEVLVDVGDNVEEGQLLARLADDTVAAQLRQAEAEFLRAQAAVSQAVSQITSAEAALDQAASALDRAQRLRQSGNIAQAGLDQAIALEASARSAADQARDGRAVAEAALAQVDASRDIAKLNVDRTRIKSPAAGIIAERTAERGALASAGAAPLFTLIRDGRVEMSAQVLETALPALAPGQPASINPAGAGVVAGEVRLIPAQVDPVTRLGQVRISLEESPALRPGVFASGDIIVDDRVALTIPGAAVLRVAGRDRVLVVGEGGVLEERLVEAGLLWKDRREIKDGLAEGEGVVARAGAFFHDGDHVRVVEAEETAP